jgi:hypothetical protein
MSNAGIINEKGLPQENRPLKFTDEYGYVWEGLYIKKEDMFFIGFEDIGDFRFSFQVTEWEYIDESKNINY